MLLIITLGWVIFAWKEYQIRLKCNQQNLLYVRTPSQMFSIFNKKRFDLIEMELIKHYGKVYGCYFLGKFTIVIADAELAQTVFNKEFTKLANRRETRTYDEILDNFLFFTKDEKWKRLRSIMSPAFSSGKLRKLFIGNIIKVMIEHMDRMLTQDQIVNIKEVMGAFTMDAILQIIYGIKIDSLRDPNNVMIKMTKQLFEQEIPTKDTIFFTLASVFPKLIKYLRIRFQNESMKYFEKCAMEIIQKKQKELKLKPKSYIASNFIELILKVEKEQKNNHVQNYGKNPSKYITNKELVAQCITFFMAGFDTMSTTIANTCWLLASNPEKQEKLHKSIVETLKRLSTDIGSSTSKDPYELITFDTLNKFEYLNAVLNESMRILTLITATERLASEDFRLESSDKKTWFDVKKGDVIRVMIEYLHKDPDNFFNPEQFIPERFLSSNQNNNDNGKKFKKHAFVPFGSGPRNCLAKNLALFKAKMALIHLIRLFRFEIDEKSKSPIDFYINADILISKDIHLRVEKREPILKKNFNFSIST